MKRKTEVTPTEAGQWRWALFENGIEVCGGGGYGDELGAREAAECELAFRIEADKDDLAYQASTAVGDLLRALHAARADHQQAVAEIAADVIAELQTLVDAGVHEERRKS